jgi:hypothetical protein
MPDRFQEILSKLEQQLTKSLAEARAMQSEPLERSRDAKSRFDMVSPGEKDITAESFGSPKQYGANTGGDTDKWSDEISPRSSGLGDPDVGRGNGLETPASDGDIAGPRQSYRLDQEARADVVAETGPASSSSPPIESAAASDSSDVRTVSLSPAISNSSTPDEEGSDPAPPETDYSSDVSAPTLLTQTATGEEDAAIDLAQFIQASPDGQDGTLTVTISGVPAGASFSAGTEVAPGIWSFTEAELQGLVLNPPANSDVDFTLNVTATLTDSSGHSASSSAQFEVHLDAVADRPIINAAGGNETGISGAEDQVIALNLEATLADTDGSETLAVTISGLPLGASLSAGVPNADGTWTLTQGQLAGLTLSTPANFNGDFTLRVEASATEGSNGDTATTLIELPVHVAPVNDAPTNLTLSGSVVAENTPGAVIGAVGASDADAGDTIHYTVLDNRFEVVDGSLKLKDGVSLNHEAEPSVTVKVTATDSGGLTSEHSFGISVTDQNEAPTTPTPSNAAIAENLAGAIVGQVASTDPDAGDHITYTVSDNRFEIVDGSLKLKDGVALDHEAEPSINVKVTATDTGGLSSDHDFTIQVTDQNEAPGTPSLSNLSVAENAAGATIGSLTTLDPDAGDTIHYTVSDNRFEVVDGSLKLKDGASLNHETEPSVTVKVTATDSGGLTSEHSFGISVTDQNEAPTSPTLSNAPIAENLAGAIVGQVASADPDAGDHITYSVSDARFEIVDGSLKLKDGVALDHEAEPSINVKVTATDTGGLASDHDFTIQVTDQNEAPSTPSLGNLSVAENAAGATIGTLTTLDPDAGDTIHYTVSDNRFEVVDGNLKLKDGVSLNHEAEPSVTVKVTATDSGGLTSEHSFGISVTDQNEAPTTPTLSNAPIAENLAGAIVGQVSSTDPDAGDNVTFSVSDARFEIVDGSLKLKDGVALDHEAEPSINVKVTATDTGGLASDHDFTIQVTDQNEAPGAPTLSNLSVTENAAGATVGTISSLDPDAGDTIHYTVSDNRFEVVDGSLKLKDGATLNH